MKRYIVSSHKINAASEFNDLGILGPLMDEDDVIGEYVISEDYYNKFHCIIYRDSDDVQGALEDTLHRMIDAGKKNYVYQVMGLQQADDDEVYDEESDFNPVDLGYGYYGSILSFEKKEI